MNVLAAYWMAVAMLAAAATGASAADPHCPKPLPYIFGIIAAGVFALAGATL